jgi:enterochelin esterase-like enzyme
MSGGNAPLPRYSRSALAVRILAAVAIVGISIGARELVLEDEPANSNLRGARVIDEFEVSSELIGETLPVRIVVPRGAADGRRALLVFLHGRGDDENSYLDDEMFRALARQGGRAPVVAFPGGDPDSYWHDRDSGEWGSFVLDELVPELVERFDIEPERVGIGGISMGGSGALDIARQDPDTFCAVGGHSPAVWTDADETAPGAYDDEDDFEAHDPITLVAPPASPLAGKRVWIDVGSEDPFAEAVGELVRSLRESDARVGYRSWPGAHEDAYWSAHWDQYMRFYATALKQCQVPLGPEEEPEEPEEPGEEAEEPAEDEPAPGPEAGPGTDDGGGERPDEQPAAP